jgi:hypothetical protein
MCAISVNTHSRVASLLISFDSLRLASSDKNPLYRWTIDSRYKQASLSPDTLTSCMQLVNKDIKVNPPDEFAWTSHSLRKGAITATYAIGVHCRKSFFPGGWATESSVVLHYVDPTLVPTTMNWYFFGWLAPWGG